jgi:diketogulonate reductase-like aldo/keto reductase
VNVYASAFVRRYGTEREMGVAIKEYLVENPGIKREDIWVTTKVHAGLTDVAQVGG